MASIQIILFCIISLLDISLYSQTVEKQSFCFLFDKSDKLMSRTESLQKIEFQFNHREKDTGPIEFIFDKNSNTSPEFLSDINKHKIIKREDLNKLEQEFYSYLHGKGNKKPETFSFLQWLNFKYKSFYLIEKIDNKYVKYKVTIDLPAVDFEIR